MNKPIPIRNSVGRPKRNLNDAGSNIRELTLNVAERLLLEHGYAAMSLDDVAKGAGVTKGSLYHYFPGGKDALIVAVAHQMLDRDRDGLAAAIASETNIRQKMLSIVTWVFETQRQTERALRDAQRFLPQLDNQSIFGRFMGEFFNQLETMFLKAQQQAKLKPHDSNFVAWAFLGMVTEFADLKTTLRQTDLPEKIVNLILASLE